MGRDPAAGRGVPTRTARSVTRDLAAGGHDESIAQPEWSPDGILHFVSDRSGWWNLYRLAEGPRLEPLAPAGGRVRRPGLGLRPLVVRVPARRLDRRPSVAHVAATGSSTSTPGSLVGEVESPFTEFGDAARRSGTAWWPTSGSPTEPPMHRRARSGDPRPIGVLRRSTSRLDRPALDLGARVRSRSRRPAAAWPTPCSTDRPTPTSAAPTASCRRSSCVARRPDGERVNALDLGIQLPDQPRHRRRRRRLRRQHRLRPRVPPVARRRVGRRRRRRLRRRPRASWSTAATSIRDRLAIEGGSAGGYTTLAALAFRDVFAAGISLFGVGDLERSPATPTSSSRATWTASSGRTRSGPTCYRERSPIHFLDDIACPVLVLQGLDDRVVPPAKPRRSSRPSRPTASRTPTSPSRARATASAARPPSARTLEARLAFLGAVFGFTPADDIEPLELPGIEAWRARRTRSRSAEPGRHRSARSRSRAVVTLAARARGRSSSSSSALRRAIGLSYLARRLRIADPILLLLGGVVLGPRCSNLPRSSSTPDLVFLLFLPPILFAAAYFTPIRDFKANARPILLLADRARAVHDGRRRRSSSRPSCPASTPAVGLHARRHRRAAGRRRRPRRSSGAWACRAGSSRSWRARASSTTPSALIAYRVAVGGALGLVASRWSTRPVSSSSSASAASPSASIVGLDRDARAVPDRRPDPRDRRLADRAVRPPTSPPRSSACSGVLATVVGRA